MKIQQHICTENLPVHLVDQVASVSPDTPLTHQEDKLATSLIRRKLAQESQDGLIHFKTGGQVYSMYTQDYACHLLIRTIAHHLCKGYEVSSAFRTSHIQDSQG